MWEIVLIDEVRAWYDGLSAEADAAVTAAIDNLEMLGPQLGRPLADRVKGSRLHNMKELRPLGGSIRILFVFDPQQQAVLLVAGDKERQWKSWYRYNIPLAEERYEEWLAGEHDEEV